MKFLAAKIGFELRSTEMKIGQPSWHSREPTHNSTHIIYGPGRESNRGHLGERRNPPCYPYTLADVPGLKESEVEPLSPAQWISHSTGSFRIPGSDVKISSKVRVTLTEILGQPDPGLDWNPWNFRNPWNPESYFNSAQYSAFTGTFALVHKSSKYK